VGSWIAAAIALICLLLVLLPRGEVRGRGLSLLRCFFPSWRFFEDIAAGPRLEVSVATRGHSFEAWRDAWVPAPRTAASLILNARGNLELAYQSLVDQLWSELEEHAEPASTESITYRLVQHIIERECLTAIERASGATYRFRLSLPDGESRVAFTSAPHSLEAP
jgi:hypothetical protein